MQVRCLAVLGVLLLVSMVSAHIPVVLPDVNGSPGAVLVEDTMKSIALYGRLHTPGEADYFALPMEAGSLLRVSLSTPDPGPFSPLLVVMGPALPENDTLPGSIVVPGGYRSMVIPGSKGPDAEYEPFTPMSTYQVSEYTFSVDTPAIYYVAVYSEDLPGNYILATGVREEFTLTEWTLIPIGVLAIRMWERQNPVLFLGPVVFTVLFGLILTMKGALSGMRPGAAGGCAIIAGLLYAGSGFSTMAEMFAALSVSGISSLALVTAALVAVQILLGILALHIALRGSMQARARTGMAAIGIAGLVFWAGFLIGPIIALLSVVLPDRRFELHGRPGNSPIPDAFQH
ncbi:MAG: hypothetical protein LUQ25_05215 [Methanoregulaceae archaeon]|nr:hypothetical protein [Methanoregulaceae archaeon]